MAQKIFSFMPKCVILVSVMTMELKDYRTQVGITIKEASLISGVPVRTYIRYENDNSYGNVLKRKQILLILRKKFDITEDNGILSIDRIKECVEEVFSSYKEQISFCYLFGSYAKGYASDSSDVDLCVSTSLTGLSYVGLIEELRQKLCKKIDVIRLNDLSDNFELLSEIMKDGVKIYG